MRKLVEVQQARELMTEALDWSVFKWMFEKPRVRETADMANDALDRLEQTVKGNWSNQLKAAYGELTARPARTGRRNQKDQQSPQSAGLEIRLLTEKIKELDDAASLARMHAEQTFDEAEKYLNITLAREGCQKAIYSWELHEKAIRKAESAMETAKSEA